MKIFLKIISIVLVLTSVAYAQKMGTVSVFTFLDGNALQNNEVLVDGKQSFKTDTDGSVEIPLEVGFHQIEVFGKDAQGSNIGYAKQQVEVKESRDTQAIVTFSKEGESPDVNVDTPIGKLGVSTADIKDLPKAVLNGIVLTSDKNLPIANARIFVKGTSIDTKSDENGKFSVKIPADTNVSISVVHSEYSAQTINDIVIKKDSSLTKEIKLTPASMELEEFIVLAPKVQGSIASIMAEEKKSNSISNILGSQEMSKKGDSSAASALKRVTGVTLIGGKSIFVRGLGDRYSNIELNSMPLPSPDPTKRVVPLDIFPSGVISSMKVQKSATADIPSNFGGGYVDIRTKDHSKDNYIKIDMGVKSNSNTGKSVDSYAGSSTDFLGFDDGYRTINPLILGNSKVVVGERLQGFTTDYLTKDEISYITQTFADREYKVINEKLPIGFAASVEGALTFDIDDDNKITMFGNYAYDQDHKFREEDYFKYDMEKETGKLYEIANQEGTTRRSVSEYSHSAMFNIGYNYMDLLKLKYTTLFTHNAEKNTRVVSGIMGSNDEDMTKYYLDWEERTLRVNQINGEIDYELLNSKSKLSFGAESASAKLSQPNNFHYTYRNEGTPFLDNKISNNIANKLESDDELTAFYIKNKLNLEMLSEDDYIDMGFSLSSKERISRQNKFFLRKIGGSSKIDDAELTADIDTIYDTYVRNYIDYDDRAFLVSQLFTPADYFDANVDETNFYLSTFLKPMKNLEVLLGARYADLTQVVYQYKEDRQNPDMSKRRLIQKFAEDLSVNDIYPSLSMKYVQDDNNHIDMAFSKTYIIPDLREFTDGEYFHPYDVATVVGNPNLKNTDIYNLDLKFSHYFSDSENIKFGLFYKYLDKPIEDVMIPSSSLPIYSYDNADKATIYGFELDGRKKLDIVHKYLSNYYLSVNFSYTDSDVSLREEQKDIYSTNHRQLQGLSQTVVNMSLSYDIKNRSATLSYNKMGERIRKVGMIDDGDKFPDYYEVPPSLLDFVWIEKYDNGVDFKLKLGNILDEYTVWKQGSSNITNKFKKGRTFSAKVSYKF